MIDRFVLDCLEENNEVTEITSGVQVYHDSDDVVYKKRFYFVAPNYSHSLLMNVFVSEELIPSYPMDEYDNLLVFNQSGVCLEKKLIEIVGHDLVFVKSPHRDISDCEYS